MGLKYIFWDEKWHAKDEGLDPLRLKSMNIGLKDREGDTRKFANRYPAALWSVKAH